MANGRLTPKQVGTWFGGLDFDGQRSVLNALGRSHNKLREAHIGALRRQLAALEKTNAPTKRKLRKSSQVKTKYRDPKTGDTWSGRGRMARWLAAKVKAGEKAARYLVR